MAAPLIIVLSIELGLRFAGKLRPTDFWVPTSEAGEWMPNPQFASQFVGPSLARMPRSIRIKEIPPTNVFRVLLFGESAALGDPEPSFGVSRFLEALLDARLPNRSVEVINTSITALNSHALRKAARDSCRFNADFWIVYAGNNEVIGPFGPATVGTAGFPRLFWIRLGLLLRQTAIGQWITDRTSGSADGLSLNQRWVGLEQFLNRPVSHSDPRLLKVREYFAENLHDIIKAGLRAGAQVIVSTMAVNLVDSPPFHSLLLGETNTPEHRAWVQACQAGGLADDQGSWPEAVAAWTNAAALKPDHAETFYRLGLARLNAGQYSAGRSDLERARDLDSLRFRADSEVNQMTRQVAGAYTAGRVLLIDADLGLHGIDTNRPPGADLFLEHVHLRPEGNYQLAKLFAEQIVAQLGALSGPTNWLSFEDCLDRLGWTSFSEARLWSQIRTLTERPPFSGQSNAELRNQFLDDRLNDANTAARRLGLTAAIEKVKAAVQRNPHDWQLREQLARLFQANRQWSNAVTEFEQVVTFAPAHVVGWYQLGESRAKSKDQKSAQAAYERALAIRPDFIEARIGLALAQGESGQLDEALKSLDLALRYSPKNLQAQVNRGIALNTSGRFDEADAALRAAASDHPQAILPLVRLGDILSARKDYSSAIQAYTEAAQREPANAALSHRLAVELSRIGRITDAQNAFRQALTLQPNFVEARLDLGVALAQQARFSEAIPEFEAALQIQPTNRLALQYLQLAREKLSQKKIR